MGRGKCMVSKFIAAAILASTALVGVPAYADDPQELSGGSQMLPGEDTYVFNSLDAAARYTAAASFDIDQQIVKRPTSYSSCLTTLLQEAQQINDMFENGFSISDVFAGGVSLNVAISNFAEEQFKDYLFKQLNNEACAVANQFQGVQNGLVVGTSIGNLMGGAKGALTIAPLPDPNSPDPKNPTQLPNTSTADQASASGDDLDAIANSGGASLTGMTPMPSAGGVQMASVPDNTSPSPPTPIALVDAGKPGPSTPQNATTCIPPDNLNWQSHSFGTTDYSDWPTITKATYANSGNSNGDYSWLTNQQAAQQASAPPSTVVPPKNDAPPTQGKKQAMVPAGQSPASGPISCQGGTLSADPGVVSTGTPCTAKDKVQCMSGSNCSSQNGSIGVAKYAQNFVLGGPPFSYAGTNLGQCVSLSRSLVPNLQYTGTWRGGPAVMGNMNLQFGTPIATMFGPHNTYKNPTIIQHTGIYMGQLNGGMFMMEQYHMAGGGIQKPCERFHPWQVGGRPQWTSAAGPANRQDEKAGANYYVILN